MMQILRGGQGRTPESLHDSAWGIVVVALACAALALTLTLFAAGCSCCPINLNSDNPSALPIGGK